MTQEDKQLLLVDLSARLSHGVFCVGITYELDDDGERYIPVKVKDTLTEIHNYKLETASVRLGLISSCKLETVKPYLRPMSSMTEEEFTKLKEYSELKYDQLDLASFQNGTYKCLDFYLNEIPANIVILVFDWLNENHFDYRGLIERGLAIEAQEGMYNLNEK